MSRRSRLCEEFFDTGKAASCAVYDLHGHMGPFFGARLGSCDADSMVARMDRAGVRLLAFSHHGALLSPDAGNAAALDAVRRYPDRLRAYCGINPNYPALVERDLSEYDRNADAYLGLKFLSDYHRVPLTDDSYRPAWEFANDRGLVVLCHTWGGSGYDGPAQVRAAAGLYPRTSILMGHCCHGDWEQACAIANDFPHVYLDLCAVTDERGILEMFVRRCGSEKVVFGTDFPWFNHHYYIGSVLGADITDADRHNIFHRNAERLLGIAEQ